MALRTSSAGLVICDACFADGRSWKDVLCEVRDLASTPPLIVTYGLVDAALWAEVLNLGGYDLLLKPFAAREVLHVVSAANRFRENEERRLAAAPQRRPVRSGSLSGVRLRGTAAGGC
jgi:DNA-binding response OmpR family regulator